MVSTTGEVAHVFWAIPVSQQDGVCKPLELLELVFIISVHGRVCYQCMDLA